MNRKKRFLRVIPPFVFLFLMGCAEGRIYVVDLKYLPLQKPAARSVIKAMPRVGVVSFRDVRPRKADLGELVHSQTRIDTFILKGQTLSHAVTEAVKSYFKERGFEVVSLTSWDLTADGMSALPPGIDLAIGGTIEAFWVNAKSGYTVTEARYRIKLVGYIGNPAKREVIQRSVESAPKVKDLNLRFDPEDVGDTLNKTMNETIAELFRNLPIAFGGGK